MSDAAVYNDKARSRMRGTGWTRWVPEPIQVAPRAPAEEPPRPAPQADAASLAEKLHKAWQQAHEQGHAEGYAAGHSEGLTQGMTEGRQQGYEAGHQEGYDAGHKQGADEAREAAQQLTTLAQECASALTRIEADMGEAMISLAVRIAEQVLHSTIQTEPQKLLDLIGDLIRVNLDKSAALQLHVNPADFDLVQSYLRNDPDTALWRVIADEGISQGGCKARTALGDIDATLETRWRRVVSTLGQRL